MAYSVPPSSEPSIAIFSKSANENIVTGTTVIGFNTNASYNSPIVLNTYTAGSDNSTFTFGASGLYGVELNVSVSANGSQWTGSPLRQVSFVLTRGGTTATIGSDTVNITSGIDYSIHAHIVFPFLVGDSLQIQHIGVVTSGTPLILGLANTFDLNTWAVFSYIKSV
jgi:hypothetical protein